MWKKIERYYHTLKYLKKSQLFYLVKNRLEQNKKAVTMLQAPDTQKLHLWMSGLDECPDYLKRFDVEELLQGQVTLLHEKGEAKGKNWRNPDRSHLWNFNLHYLEYLISLAAAFRREGRAKYYKCFRSYCRQWIRDNEEGTGDGWHPYTISLRLTNLWICMDGFGDILQKDTEFLGQLQGSMYAQYRHLQKRLELHLLGNHYFENVKAVLLGSLYFQEPAVYKKYKRKLTEEIREQILPDGVHYERSLMYHKIILEDVMRVAKALMGRRQKEHDQSESAGLGNVMQRMADAAYSLEAGMGQTPLFNDSGDNVARPLPGLLAALQEEFQTWPCSREAFPAAGYYCLKDDDLKLIFDAGEIAPDHMPGHGHCDGLSFELSWKGRPFFVNSGTGQYQGELRSYFRSTAAHNTVVIDHEEQSECWGEHRVGDRMLIVSGECESGYVKAGLITFGGICQGRIMELKDHLLTIRDQTGGHAQAYFHLAPDYEYVLQEPYVLVLDRERREACRIQGMPKDRVTIHKTGQICSYAPEFGKTEQIQVLEIAWKGDRREHRIQIGFEP